MAAKTKVRGIRELLDKLQFLRAPGTVDSIGFRATAKTARVLVDLAKDYARRSTHQDSGALLEGFAHKQHRRGTKLGYTVGVRAGKTRSKSQKEKGADPFYWWFLEFGTVHNAPRHFFRDAFNVIKSTGDKEIIERGKRAVLSAGNAALKRYGNGKRLK